MKERYDIDTLISKFLAGEASPEEAMQLEDWKALSPENQAYFDESLALLGLVDHAADTDAAWTNVRPELKPAQPARVRKLNPRMIYNMAAAFVVLLAIGSILYFMLPEGSAQVYTAKAQEKNVRLSDGTDITIAAHSSVTLAPGYGKKNRLLKLDGSGYFSVKHSEKLPFVIDAGPIRIKDLGTKFDVRQTADTIFVRVDEGLVMIYDNNGVKITLKANETAYYVISTGDLELEIATNSPTATGKTFVFDNQKVEQVIQRMSTVYKADIRIENASVNNCLITTQFNDEDLEVALAVVAETLGLTLEKQGNTYILKGESTCTH